jgi:hypothetical protein
MFIGNHSYISTFWVIVESARRARSTYGISSRFGVIACFTNTPHLSIRITMDYLLSFSFVLMTVGGRDLVTMIMRFIQSSGNHFEDKRKLLIIQYVSYISSKYLFITNRYLKSLFRSREKKQIKLQKTIRS